MITILKVNWKEISKTNLIVTIIPTIAREEAVVMKMNIRDMDLMRAEEDVPSVMKRMNIQEATAKTVTRMFTMKKKSGKQKDPTRDETRDAAKTAIQVAATRIVLKAAEQAEARVETRVETRDAAQVAIRALKAQEVARDTVTEWIWVLRAQGIPEILSADRTTMNIQETEVPDETNHTRRVRQNVPAICN
jgi:hypothetical protein